MERAEVSNFLCVPAVLCSLQASLERRNQYLHSSVFFFSKGKMVSHDCLVEETPLLVLYPCQEIRSQVFSGSRAEKPG